ncbi:ABC transporter ATP-binding protein [Cupriavidus sp. USMAA2-4]|uniref:ABC transporter ATP-binding protein n=1 Tax=Cupriavidus malaysiensis TaxID=367825 RepID=A0ABM6F6Y5_9BURK|nr:MULTISPECIES: ABC transporter ATP-binding protein [Cupriavidus]AOY93003.1 ABC transporter ATP-binding protein [Cupriavidus sp. USMAA2-4]AOZ07340.1 ABC transporter ATP-binding protein [Cupriavidus malaysiensis]
MSSKSVIRVDKLGKRYEIYAQPKDRLKQMVVPRLKRMVGMHPPEYFREFWALRGVSFDVQQGETVAIIGQNGSGKSTLLQLVCGTLFPTSGEVSVSGRIAALLELGAGFNPEFTGEENVYLSGLLYGIEQDELAKRFDSIVAFAEIGDFINQPVKTYSSGMYVRLAFAIAAHVDADVLVVDEALSVGDVRFTQKCMRFLREFQKTGTLLFVSHDVGAVTSLCSRAIWLDHGELKMDGNAKETVEAYLAEQHALDRGALGVSVKVGAAKQRKPRKKTELDVVDARWEKLRAQGGGTQIEVFEFDPEQADSEFGARGASIVDAVLVDEHGEQLKLVHGGELVELRITAELHAALDGLIFGFYLKDRLGQRLFGDNTFLATLEDALSGEAGKRYRASFLFRMPTLPVGAYSVDAAVASGTQQDHTQQHWVHDALTLRAVDSSMRHGLVGIPMLDIAISEEE